VAPAAPNTLKPGVLLADKWRIESLLGTGGMGAVYAARHVRNGREVAIKVLHPALGLDASAVERFLHEGYAANRVDHPGTVQVLDDGQAPEGAFLVMERLRGVPLDQVASANEGDRLELLQVLAILDASLEILAEAHRRTIVHRDFKPENLFLTSDGKLKVLDFGLARVKETEGAARLTATGVPMGTPAFMPPEQALAHWEEVDTRSDVYAIGASTWTLLTGRLVHEGRTAPELLVKASTQHARPLQSVAPHVPEAIARVIDRSLAFDRQARFPDAGAMREALTEAIRSLGLFVPSLASIPLPGVPALAEARTEPNPAALAAKAYARAGTGLDTGPTLARPVSRPMLPSFTSDPAIQVAARSAGQGPASAELVTGTVAPTTTDATGLRRSRARAGMLVAGSALVATVLVVVSALAVAAFLRSGSSSVAADGTPSAPPPELSAQPSSPVVDVTPVPSESAAAPPDPVTSASAAPKSKSKGKSRSVPPVVAPKSSKGDPLNKYK
jgi:serine/threonine-protein kinase